MDSSYEDSFLCYNGQHIKVIVIQMSTIEVQFPWITITKIDVWKVIW